MISNSSFRRKLRHRQGVPRQDVQLAALNLGVQLPEDGASVAETCSSVGWCHERIIRLSQEARNNRYQKTQ